MAPAVSVRTTRCDRGGSGKGNRARSNTIRVSFEREAFLKASPSVGDVSVVIPAYNVAAFLPETLASVFAQTLLPAEVIVVDDGSTDDTAEIARNFGATVISRANGGISAARNTGIRAARCGYVALLDADDLWMPEKLEVQLAALAAAAVPSFSFTDFHTFDSRGVRPVKSTLRAHPAFRRTVRRAPLGTNVVVSASERRPVLPDIYFLPSSAVIRRADILAVGGFDESLRGCEDTEFFLRLFKLVPAIAVMRPLMRYRRHEAQNTASPTRVMRYEFAMIDRIVHDPTRYPIADVRYYRGKSALIHHRIGVCEARLGRFDAALTSFETSLQERRTLRTFFALVAAQSARNVVGRSCFVALRAIRRAMRSY
jgi:glycosyltransferase involved in cell wall biosynthesis